MSRYHHRVRLANINLTLLSDQRFKILLDTGNTLTQSTDSLTDTSR